MKKKTLERLPLNFDGVGEVSGFRFTQTGSRGAYRIYHVVDKDSRKEHYELIKTKLSPKCIDFEKRIYSETEFKETYPKSSAGGKTLFTFHKHEDAVIKLNELTNDR